MPQRQQGSNGLLLMFIMGDGLALAMPLVTIFQNLKVDVKGSPPLPIHSAHLRYLLVPLRGLLIGVAHLKQQVFPQGIADQL
jgi:hypothetical protein